MSGNRLAMTKTCLVCEQDFRPFEQSQMYCSRECYNKGRGKHRNNTRVLKTCETCGSEFAVKLYRAETAKHCSRQCWSNRNPPSYLVCNYCGKDFRSYDRNAIFCSRKCKYLAAREKTGKKAPRYIDGKSLLRQRGRDSRDLKRWRKAVYDRDNYTCQHCGKSGVLLNAHHIKSYAAYPESRFDVNNGISLCIPCHEKVHGRKLSVPTKFPKTCSDCGKQTKGRGWYCHSCANRRAYAKRRI